MCAACAASRAKKSAGESRAASARSSASPAPQTAARRKTVPGGDAVRAIFIALIINAARPPCDNAPMEKIAILCCGGTIDKIYFDAKSAYRVGKPAAEAVLRRARIAPEAEVAAPQSLLRKDSLDITAADRETIAAAVRKCKAKRMVITHGTDTMPQTARAVESALKQKPAKNKTVVFTGAFSPAKFRESDSDFNIGFALACARLLPTGVYIAINGKILPAATAKKNRKAGVFESGG